MNTKKMTAIITIALVAAALATASAIAFLGTPKAATTATTYTNYPSGMMNGNGNYAPTTSTNPQTTQTQPTTAEPPTTTTTPPTTTTTPLKTTTTSTQTQTTLTVNDAVTIAQNYLATLGNPNLAVKTIQEYTNTFYAQVVEKDTGAGAFELAINKQTGAITPMQGPTMMWNTKYGATTSGMMGYLTTGTGLGYGMMGNGGMMNWLRGTPTTTMQVAMDQARAVAQQYLNTNY